MLEAGEGSGACSGIQAHPIPVLTQDAQRDIRGFYGATSENFGGGGREHHARSHTLGSVTTLLVPSPLGQETQQHPLHRVMQKVAA